ncbi:unnamed protein product [Prunus brigantina]
MVVVLFNVFTLMCRNIVGNHLFPRFVTDFVLASRFYEVMGVAVTTLPQEVVTGFIRLPSCFRVSAILVYVMKFLFGQWESSLVENGLDLQTRGLRFEPPCNGEPIKAQEGAVVPLLAGKVIVASLLNLEGAL